MTVTSHTFKSCDNCMIPNKHSCDLLLYESRQWSFVIDVWAIIGGGVLGGVLAWGGAYGRETRGALW